MTQTIRAPNGLVLLVPTPEEDAAIHACIAQDPETCDLGTAEFKQLRRGRPLGSGTKTQVTLRLDADVLEKFRASGDGWQTRINDALKSGVKTHA